jgi:hypothetical protein
MKPESSKNSNVDGQIKGFPEGREKFVSPRMFAWPRELFVELTFSQQDALKMRRWEQSGHEITPVFYVNGTRVLFVNWTLLEKWKSRKRPR